jgi:hypothetical protein
VKGAELLRSLETLFIFPPEHRIADVERKSAQRLLGCDDHTLAELIERGLPVTGEPGRERFDSRELFNLALYSGSGVSAPEQAFAYSLRWMRSTTDALLAARSSRFELRIECPECLAAGGSARRSVLALPAVTAYDGDVRDLAVDPLAVVEGGTVTATAGSLGVRAIIDTCGEMEMVRAPALRAAVRGFVGAGLRWVKLPPALRADVDLALTHRIATCESASLYLQRLCQQAGFPATTRIGWVVGMLDLVHAWVEVIDDDGRTKVIDPIFTLFSATIPRANPVLSDPDIALRTNRLVPTGLEVGESVAWHGCPDEAAPVRVVTKILPEQLREAA